MFSGCVFLCNGRSVANSLILNISMQLKARFQFVDTKKVEVLLCESTRKELKIL